jgi:uncharacterized protein YodC (DUF2158 family)
MDDERELKMADEFKAGDVVKLKSSGPLMTVISVANGEADCEWFDDKKVPQRRAFAVTSLKLSESSERRQGQAGGRGGQWS